MDLLNLPAFRNLQTQGRIFLCQYVFLPGKKKIEENNTACVKTIRVEWVLEFGVDDDGQERRETGNA